MSGIAGSCFDIEELRGVLAVGRFADGTDEGARALDHFGRHCPHCWRRLGRLAADGSVPIDLDAAVDAAAASSEQLPVALVLCRLAAHAAGSDRGLQLPPTHRFLLGRAGETVFAFWWLLVEEVRLLALSCPGKGVERWRCVDAILAARIAESPSLSELRVLTRAYRADEHRVAGEPREAERLMVEALKEAASASAAIEATVYETQADLDRAFGKPYQALWCLEVAERLVRRLDVIPGRLADTLARKGFTCLLLGRLEEALVVFDETLETIPANTDSRLRLDVLLHMAAIKVRKKLPPAALHYLDAAAPLLDRFATRRMRAQYDWLRGLIHLRHDELAAAERRLRRALAGMYRFGPLLARAQILVRLGEIYVRTDNRSELARVAEDLAAVVSRPEIKLYARGKVEEILRQAAESGVEICATVH